MILKNSRHERFAQLVASGRSQAESYRAVFPASRQWSNQSVAESASKLSAKIAPRLAALKEAGATKAIVTKVEVCEWLSGVVRSQDGQGGGLAARLQAAGLLGKLLGWYAEERHDVTFRFKPDDKVLAVLRGG